jgi:RNA polymerase sigma factor (sigma-70 family)
LPDARARPQQEDDVFVELVPMVRKIVASRIRDPHVVDDLVQETLARVLAARSRVEGDTLAPYAAVTARNLVASFAKGNDRARNSLHLLAEADVDVSDAPGASLLRHEEDSLVATALARLPLTERDLLVAHEVDHQDTRTLAVRHSSTPGAVAAQLGRVRAKLRVEYLLVQEQLEPTSDLCRPVLRAISASDRRRQRELGAGAHLLGCDCCARVSALLLDRRAPVTSEDESAVSITRDADVVTARQVGRETAARVGFSGTDLTLIATAISEIARNIVRFAERGEMVIAAVEEAGRRGVMVVARDNGPGIADVDEALRDGYSTDEGLGLGLPGAKRLMDDFDVVAEAGKGTTVTMTKWRHTDRPPTDHRPTTDRRGDDA